MSQQLELFTSEPFSVRLTISDGIAFFRKNHWDALPKGKATGKCFKRLAEFFSIKGVKYVDEISKLSIQDLRKWLADLGFKPATVNTHHMIVTAWINKLLEWKEAGVYGGLDFRPIPLPLKNPGSQVPKVKEVSNSVAWPKKVVYKFIDAATYMGDLDLAEDIEILYLTGLRPGDLWHMTSKNVDLAHMVLSGIQHKSVTSRMPSGLPYLIAVTPRMATILSRRIERTPVGEPLFRSTRIAYDTWRRQHNRRFNVLRSYLKMWHVQLRHMRHSSTTLLIDNGVDTETVRERGGWTTDRQLPVYARRRIVHQRKAQEVLEDEESEITI